MSAAEDTKAAIIRPSDTRALLALRRLARDYPGGATVIRGEVTLVGVAHPAMLAINRDGHLLAAVLLDARCTR